MSIEAMAIVLHHSKLNGAQKLLMLGVANHAGDGGAYPSQLRLATYCGVSDLRNLRRIIDKCVESGELSVTVQAGGGINTPDHNRSNLYEIHVQCPPNCDRTMQHRLLCWGCDEPLPFARYRVTADDDAGVPRTGWHKRCAQRVLELAAEPVDNDPRAKTPPPGEIAPPPGANTPPEPLTNPSNPDISIRTDVSAREASPVDDEHCLESSDGVHPFAELKGKPWRCTACGIHHDELVSESSCGLHRGASS